MVSTTRTRIPVVIGALMIVVFTKAEIRVVAAGETSASTNINNIINLMINIITNNTGGQQVKLAPLWATQTLTPIVTKADKIVTTALVGSHQRGKARARARRSPTPIFLPALPL